MLDITWTSYRPLHEHENATAETSWGILMTYAFPGLQSCRKDYIIRKCGTLTHYYRLQAYLNRKVPNLVIERVGPVLWNPCPPNLTRCHLIWWCDMKYKIKNALGASTEQSRRRIRAEIHSICEEILKNVWDNMTLRLRYIRKRSEGHIKPFYTSKKSISCCLFASKDSFQKTTKA